MFDVRRRLIFVHIQKTGGSAINLAFGQPQNPPEKHRDATELRALYGEAAWSQSFKFSIVRNPWDRLVSWWTMIDSMRAHVAAGGAASGFIRYVLQNALSFEQFIGLDGEIADADGRKRVLRPQLSYITDAEGRLMVDHVGRFERLGAEVAVVAALRGKPVTLRRINASQHGPYHEAYTPSMRDRVGEAFAADIAAFGYRFEADSAEAQRVAAE